MGCMNTLRNYLLICLRTEVLFTYAQQKALVEMWLFSSKKTTKNNMLGKISKISVENG